MKQKSASALQIEEKHKRQQKMLSLAIDQTKAIIRKMLHKNPDLTDNEIFDEVKKKPITISRFLNTYIQEVAVSTTTAQNYFDVYSWCLHPHFIKVKFTPNARVKQGFILDDLSLQFAIIDIRDEQKKNKR